MTNNADKRAARLLQRERGISYTEALRLVQQPDQADPKILCTFTFTGPGSPASVTFDIAGWLDMDTVERLRSEDFEHDPNRHPWGYDYMAGALRAAAKSDPVLRAAHEWVEANTGHGEATFEVPNEHGEFVTVGEPVQSLPYTVSVDRRGAERWARSHWRRPVSTLSDFVTPIEQRRWLDKHYPGDLDCANSRHHFDCSPSPLMGECIGCGALMLVEYDGDGEEVQRIVDEETFGAEVFATEAFCNWAPPTWMLRGQTQREWNRRNAPVVASW